ncbi:MAG: ribosome maturation factor RimP [Lachnospiraceae bacterium]|nr:ribosome maturation factor RimP [Lachnospiraceae bacterium]
MSKKEDIEIRTWELLQPILEKLDMRAVDAEYVKEAGEYYLRCYIDREGGVRIDDCEAVSRQLEVFLDEEDLIDDPYTLEVSSPGLGRILRRPHDFEFALGREVELKTFKAVDGQKEWRGILAAWDRDTVTIETSGDGGEKTFSRKELSQIRLAFDI